jgi:hypothetical protein
MDTKGDPCARTMTLIGRKSARETDGRIEYNAGVCRYRQADVVDCESIASDVHCRWWT